MNRRDFVKSAGLGLGVAVVGLEGCTAQQWFQIAEGLVPIAIQTVGALTLGPLGLSAADLALATGFGNSIVTILKDVQADVATVQANTGIIPTIKALLSQAQSQVLGLLPSLHVTNPKSVSSITLWVNSIGADVVDLLNLVPAITVTPSTTAAAKITVIKAPTASLKNLQQQFNTRLGAVQAAN